MERIKCALIGEKLGHSYSAEIHNMLGADYSLVELNADKVEDFVKNGDINYFNVTIPYKEKVIPYLTNIDEFAREIGAVNTVVKNGSLICGYNTDYFGFKSLLEHNDINVYGKKALILGTGGTSKTVYKVLSDLKAEIIGKVGRDSDLNYENCYNYDVDIIVNTTPMGMYPKFLPLLIDLKRFKNLKYVVDCVYNPLKTELVQTANNMGIKAVGGLYMLVAQAVYANAIFNGVKPDTTVIDKIYKKILFDKINIALIGMPSCGKTTIGKILSDMCGKRFVDTDQLVVQEHGDIPSIFANFGEDVFRSFETHALSQVVNSTGQIISCGGGIVKREENYSLLKRNSIVVFIKRDIEKLSTQGRPLSKDKETLYKMYEERLPLYNKYCDITVENDISAQEVAQNILKEIKCIL